MKGKIRYSKALTQGDGGAGRCKAEDGQGGRGGRPPPEACETPLAKGTKMFQPSQSAVKRTGVEDMTSRRTFLAGVGAFASFPLWGQSPAGEKPLVRIGLVADVHHADLEERQWND